MKIIVAFSLAAIGFASVAESNLNIIQATMIQTMDQVVSNFSQDYAPFEWKVESEKLDLKKEIERAQDAIRTNADIKTPEFQDLLVDLIHSFRDFHTAIHFYSTETATLPFQIMQA